MKIFLPILLILISNLCYSQADLNAGLVAYYPFNGNANDESGNGNNPVFNNATLTTDRLGNANSAYLFNGVDNYMNSEQHFPYERYHEFVCNRKTVGILYGNLP